MPSELADLIRSEIEASPGRRITFARFMELALYQPELGYYRQRADRPTTSGDFLTAPETHPVFGWTLARRIESMWTELGRPTAFRLIEYGAGSGTLGLSVFEGLRRHGATDLLQALRYEPVESNPHRLADLERRFAKEGLSDRLARGPAVSSERVPVSGVLIANEFLDALPVHRAVVRGGALRELFVVWREPAGLAQIEDEPSTPALAGRLADDGLDVASLAEGQVVEICLEIEPWLDEVSRRLERGLVLVIDYGHPAADLYGPRRLAGSLLGYRAHRVVDDPFDRVGDTDLTAHVDFTALAVLAERRAWRNMGLTSQSEFLMSAGLESELESLRASADADAEGYLRARSAIVRFLDPRHLGRFRVLTLRK